MAASGNWTEMYLRTKNAWIDKANLTAVRDGVRGAVWGTYVFSCGGRDSTGPTYNDDVYKYSYGSNTWTAMALMPGNRWKGNCEVVGNYLYYIGGLSDAATPTTTVYKYDIINNTWETKTAMSVARYDAASFVVGSTIYICGGIEAAARVNTVRTYDTVNDAWSTTTNLPAVAGNSDVDGCTGVSYGERGYVVGGEDGAGLRDEVLKFHPATGSWTSGLSTMSTNRKYPMVWSIPKGALGRIYAAGGESPVNTALSSVEYYDIDGDAWTSKTSMSNARRDGFAAFIPLGGGGASGSILSTDADAYVIGGYDFLGHRSDNEGLDIVAGSWYASFTEVNSGDGLSGAACKTDKSTYIYTFGGATATPSSNTSTYAAVYNAVDDSWASISPLPVAMRWGASCYINSDPADNEEKIYYFGGQNSTVTVKTLYAYWPRTNTWETLTSAANARLQLTGFQYGDDLFFMMGGSNNTTPSDMVQVYDMKNDSWSTGTVCPITLLQHAGAFSKKTGKYYMLGGRTDDAGMGGWPTVTDRIYEYDPVGDAWVLMTAALPVATYAGGAFPDANGDIYYMGGAQAGVGAVTAVYKFDPVADTITTVTHTLPTARAHIENSSVSFHEVA